MEYEFLEHTADIKFRARGGTKEEAFESALLAFSHYVSKGSKIKSRKIRKIEVEGDDFENLLYNFIDELIYLIDAEDFVVRKGEVKIDGMRLNAELWGDDASNYSELEHVKAATYAEMYVKKKGKNWEVQMVLDV